MSGGKGERKLHGHLSRSEVSGHIPHSAVKAVEEEGRERPCQTQEGRKHAASIFDYTTSRSELFQLRKAQDPLARLLYGRNQSIQ